MTDYQPSEYTDVESLAAQLRSIAAEVAGLPEAMRDQAAQLSAQGFGGYADFHMEERLDTLTAAFRHVLGRLEATKQYTHTATDRRNAERFQRAQKEGVAS